MMTWHRMNNGPDAGAGKFQEMEERLRKIEAATSSLLVDVSSMREKQRFMTKLQAAPEPRPIPAAVETGTDSGISPLVTQSIPILPRARR